MNKTLTINLGGWVFHIDEDAFENLNNYLNSIRRHFGNSEGALEIMADIERRIAEIFTERLKEGRQVIQAEDVKAAMEVMGTPEAIAGESEPVNGEAAKEIIRKRFFRNPDDHILGGVCGGIGAYFNFDPIWLRGAFALMFLAFGSGFLLYLVLWIIIPKARTTAEKLAMRGEPINVSNIEKSVKEEIENLKGTFQDLKNDVKDKTKPYGKARDMTHRVIGFTGEVLENFFRVAAKVIGFIFILAGLGVLTVLGIGLLGSLGFIDPMMHTEIENMTTGDFTMGELSTYFFDDPNQMQWVMASLLLLVGIPFLRILISGIEMLFKQPLKLKGLNFIFLFLWLIGLGMAIWQLQAVGSQFAREFEEREHIPLIQPAAGIIYLEPQPVPPGHEELQTLNYPGVKLRIEKADSSFFELSRIISSHGATIQEARHFARGIDFSFSQVDSLISFTPSICLEKGEKFRAQQVELRLMVPEGGSVVISEDFRDFLNHSRNDQGMEPDEMQGYTWKMGRKKLECQDCDED